MAIQISDISSIVGKFRCSDGTVFKVNSSPETLRLREQAIVGLLCLSCLNSSKFKFPSLRSEENV